MTTSTRTRVLSLLEAMTTPHRLDSYLELLDPMATVRDLRARVLDVHHDADGFVTLTLLPTRGWRGHRAGQFIRVGVVVDGVRHLRCYSPTGAEGDARIELTVRAHPGGVVSRHLQDVEAGTVVTLSEAAGTFALPTPRPPRILLVSGGSGLTPVLSMLRTLVAEGYAGEVALLHYARRRTDVPHRAELERLAAAHHHVSVVFAHTESEDGDLRGHFGPEHLDVAAPWYPLAQTYLCGPEALACAVRELYRRRGLADRLHTEEFTPPRPAAGRGGVLPGTDGGVVTFASSSTTADNTGASLLEQAEAVGLTPEYGCRMGICFTCTTVRTSGCTRNLRTGEADSAPDTPIQLCVTTAVGDVTLAL